MQLVREVEDSALLAVNAANSTTELREIELKFLGKKGSIGELMRQIGQIPADQRSEFGKAVNDAKAKVQTAFDLRAAFLLQGERAVQFEAERIDVTAPPRPIRMGRRHILDVTAKRVKDILSGLGFEYKESPDLEETRYNFDALNYPPDHPAMDDQDTFYIDDDHLMRTQTTALQGRVFEKTPPPLRVFTIGRCYRNENVDRTHGHTFQQVDAFMIDKGVSMAHLKGVLNSFARTMFGSETTLRFRPDFFPFVEPGVDFAISTPQFRGGDWLELGGAGLIHPNILERYGIDSEIYSGFAFGLGIERMPMLRYGIEDLRHFYENDSRFLSQFSSL